jgi:hypothetical protein
MLAEVNSVVTPKYYAHINIMRTQGCPSMLNFEEEISSKPSATERRNEKSSPKTLIW